MLETKEYIYDTVIVGSGAAAYNAACTLKTGGYDNIVIVTENRLWGTSRNAGSDKQTYYKLDLTGGDSAEKMAQALFAGGSVNGDTALAEAAGSARCFYNLVSLGVPFPCNEYGEYGGYKTDHDESCRASSAGPYTSKYMTQVLEKRAMELKTEIHDKCTALLAVKRDGKAAGLICLNTQNPEDPFFAVYHCSSIIIATGGPGSIYRDTVYPVNHTGALGFMAISGISFTNLSQWQFGLASIKFRWNVSGTYQQVLPKYVSVDEEGNEYDFMASEYEDTEELLRNIFLKGYQWPFDVRKINGSSKTDILVYREIYEKNRRVFMDFRRNPTGFDGEDFSVLPKEAYEYLEKSGALLKTPIERLKAMNPGAVKLYLQHGIDLEKEKLEVGISSQHCNGGAKVDYNWQTDIDGIYCAGECAGTFGVYRPGGSALNSGQVGSMRAAEHIIREKRRINEDADFTDEVNFLNSILHKAQGEENTLLEFRNNCRSMMSKYFSIYRVYEDMEKCQNVFFESLKKFTAKNKISKKSEIGVFFKNLDMLISQYAVIVAMVYAAKENGSQGAGLVKIKGELVPEKANARDFILNQIPILNKKLIFFEHKKELCRPIPERDNWFENLWREYRKRNNIDDV